MRQFLVLAAVVLAGGSYVARFADRAVVMRPPPVARQQPATLAPAEESYGRTLTLTADRQGQFEVAARIDGHRLNFMVDTGASQVILRASAAAELGIYPLPDDYTQTISTANGKIKAAPANLDRIEIGDITVYDVPALVLPDAALWKNLLGASFLSKLGHYAVSNGRMVLEQ